VYSALQNVDTALLCVNMALLREYRALLREYRALLSVDRVLLSVKGSIFKHAETHFLCPVLVCAVCRNIELF